MQGRRGACDKASLERIKMPRTGAQPEKVKQADRPDFVTAQTLANLRYSSHSSRRRITPALKLPTRTLREQHHRVPIWNCTEWRLPRFTVTEYARLCGPVPRLIPWACACGFQRTAVNRHPALWSPDLPPVAHYATTSGCLACFARIVPRRAPLRSKVCPTGSALTCPGPA